MNSELIIELNGLLINSGTTGFYLDDEVSGLEFPDVRTSSGLFSGQNGGYVSKQLFGTRSISLEGRVFHMDVAAAQQLRRHLESVLATLVDSPGPLKVTTYDGQSFLIDVYLVDFKMPIDRSQNFSSFKIDLLAPDPIIYDNATGTELSAPIYRTVTGGFSWPVAWPLVWPVASGATTVTNNGSVFVEPRIVLTGVMTNPIITNLATGQAFKLTNLVTSPGDVVTINMKANSRSILLNGSSIFEKKTSDSQWWGLVRGANPIKLDTSGGSDDVTGLVKWRNGTLGI